MVVAVTITGKSSKPKVQVEVASRGWLDEPERGELEELVAEVVKPALDGLANREADLEELSGLIRKTAGKCIKETTKRRPMIIPVISGLRLEN